MFVVLFVISSCSIKVQVYILYATNAFYEGKNHIEKPRILLCLIQLPVLLNGSTMRKASASSLRNQVQMFSHTSVQFKATVLNHSLKANAFSLKWSKVKKACKQQTS